MTMKNYLVKCLTLFIALCFMAAIALSVEVYALEKNEVAPTLHASTVGTSDQSGATLVKAKLPYGSIELGLLDKQSAAHYQSTAHTTENINISKADLVQFSDNPLFIILLACLLSSILIFFLLVLAFRMRLDLQNSLREFEEIDYHWEHHNSR